MDAKGRSTGSFAPACIDCADLLLKLRPGGNLSLLISIYRNDKGASQFDPNLRSEFEGAKVIWDSLESQQFDPASSVQKTTEYGFRVYQTYGLATETELSELANES